MASQLSPSRAGNSFQFYRRQLPDSCIGFASEEGREIFKEALNAGHMTCFFKLSAQFRTQDEPAYCGLTSLVMALNVLEIDPGRVWKGPWRWYHEDMLDCCISLDIVKEKGITMDQFNCLARCNNLTTEAFCGAELKSIDELRALVKEKVQVDNQVLIMSYSRRTLGQTGSGHFSPIAGYHEGKDLVLILDTARFKYPPHWVPLTLAMEAMKTEDADTGLPRGMVLLSRSDVYVGTLVYRPSCSFVIGAQRKTLPTQLWTFSDAWNAWLDETPSSSTMTESEVQTIFSRFVETILTHLQDIRLFCLITQSNTSWKCNELHCNLKWGDNVTKGELQQIKCVYANLFEELESLETFKRMKDIISVMSEKDCHRLITLVACSEFESSGRSLALSSEYVYQSCTKVCHLEKVEEQLKKACCTKSLSFKITAENVLTILFLTWPIEMKTERGNCCKKTGSRREWVIDWIKGDFGGGLDKRLVRQEVFSLNFKLVEVMNYHLPDGHPVFSSKQGLL